jgi:hypothetical protein
MQSNQGYIPYLAFMTPTCRPNITPQFGQFCTPVTVKLTIIYRRLWEFILRFVQQPGALSQNRQYSQRALGKLYNFDFDHIFRHEPPTSFFGHYAFCPKRKFQRFPLPLLRIQMF